jgi:transposase
MCPQWREVDTSTTKAAVDTLGRRVAPRRHRTVEEKIQIVTESRVPGVSVAEVARRHVVNANQIFAWRRQQDQGVLGRRTRQAAVKLLPVQVRSETQEPRAEASATPAELASEGRIEITLADGVRIAISGAVSAEQLHQVLAVLR